MKTEFEKTINNQKNLAEQLGKAIAKVGEAVIEYEKSIQEQTRGVEI
ncbi:hypothetical protein [Paenibacillus donghaensis]|nr:hypothetical protein [Paenibacillus donghaensis]